MQFKKEYIKPEMNIVEMGVTTILCGSSDCESNSYWQCPEDSEDNWWKPGWGSSKEND